MESIELALNTKAFGINPYPIYQKLQDSAPIYWSASWNCWIVTRHNDVTSILRDPLNFSNVGRVTSLLSHLSDVDRQRFQPLQSHFATGMVHSDPPEHSRLRKLLSYAFAPRIINQLQPRIEQIVAKLIDDFCKKGRVELIQEFAYPLPAIVISELFGAPIEDQHLFKKWSTNIGAFQGAGLSDLEIMQRSQDSLVEMRTYFKNLANKRRKNPAKDLLSALVQADEDGVRFTDDELLSVCVTMLTAGHETTTSLIGNGMLALLKHPNQLALLQENPTLIPAAIEEFLRYDGPLQRTWRRVAEDVVFEKRPFKKDQLVVVMLGSANRDSTIFPNPNQLDIERPNKQQIAFGYGVHFCIGASLARMEGQIAFKQLLSRLHDLDGEIHDLAWQTEGVFRCLKALPLQFQKA